MTNQLCKYHRIKFTGLNNYLYDQFNKVFLVRDSIDQPYTIQKGFQHNCRLVQKNKFLIFLSFFSQSNIWLILTCFPESVATNPAAPIQKYYIKHAVCINTFIAKLIISQVIYQQLQPRGRETGQSPLNKIFYRAFISRTGHRLPVLHPGKRQLYSARKSKTVRHQRAPMAFKALRKGGDMDIIQ